MDNIQRIISRVHLDEIRNSDLLHLTANEARMSNTARSFLNSGLAERYYMGAGQDEIVDFGAFTVRGMKAESELVTEAIEATKKMLGAKSVNLSVLSGVHAMMASILSLTEPGDTVMIVRKEDGGHFAAKGILERTGRNYVYAVFNHEKLTFDAEETAKTYRESGATAFYMDVSYYLNPHNLQELRTALGKDELLIYDASHTMGLILGQRFQDPFAEGADVISANTHKTLPGPHKGLIAYKEWSTANRGNKIIDGCLYSTTNLAHLLALSVTLLEMAEFGKDYAKQVITNAQKLGSAFEKLGYDVRKANTGQFTENHQVHVFIDDKGERLSLYKSLLKNNISTNFDNVLGGRTFIRLGTQEITRRGMNEDAMEVIANLVDKAFKGDNVISKVAELNSAYPDIKYSFDNRQ